jgi:hypothetical protein
MPKFTTSVAVGAMLLASIAQADVVAAPAQKAAVPNALTVRLTETPAHSTITVDTAPRTEQPKWSWVPAAKRGFGTPAFQFNPVTVPAPGAVALVGLSGITFVRRRQG